MEETQGGTNGGLPPFTAWVLLFGAVSYGPGLTLASWIGFVRRVEQVLAFTAIVFLVLAGVGTLLGRRWGASRAVAATAVFWFVLANGADTLLLDTVNRWIGLAILVGLAVLLGAATFRLSGVPIGRGGLAVLAVVLAGTPLVQLSVAMSLGSGERHFASEQSFSSGIDHSRTEDAWLIVLDGYPSKETLARYYGNPPNPFLSDLEGLGFIVSSRAVSPYSVTAMSVPSILSWDYLVTDDVVDQTHMHRAAAALSSGNRLVESFIETGYEVTWVENGWHLSGCDESIHHCIGGPIPDETVSIILSRSAVGLALGIDRAGALRRSALRNLEWLERSIAQYNTNGVSDLVVVHLLVPHPPFFLTRTCDEAPGARDRGLAVWNPDMGWTQESRRQMYVEQVQCVSDRVASVVREISPTAMIGIVSDHGPDSMGQSGVPAEDWTTAMIEERLTTIAALRLPDGCDSDLTSTLGVTAALAGCVRGRLILPPMPRAFVIRDAEARGEAIRELTGKEVQRLVVKP